MTDLQQRFRANAARMERLARTAATDAEREVFEGFALSWRRLAESPPPESPAPETREFDAPAPERYRAYAEEMEEQARAAASPEERDLFQDFAQRWRRLADDAGGARR
jgi:hypothetical protein